MAVTLNNNTDCCESTCTNTTVNVAGPTGPAGAAGSNGTNGSNGVNAYAKTTSGFTVPALGVPVGLTVDNATPFMTGMIIFIQVAGYYEVVGTTGGTINAQNLGYTGNAAIGQAIADDRLIVSAGIQGATGTSGTTFSGFTNAGDIITRDGSAQTVLSVGSSPDTTKALFQHSSGNYITWKKVAAADLDGNISLTSQVSGSLPLANVGNGISGAAAGDLLYWTGTAWARVAAPTSAEQLLGYNTGTNAPNWVSPSTSGLIFARGSMSSNSLGTLTATNAVNVGTLGLVDNSSGSDPDRWTIAFETASASTEYVVMTTNTSSSVDTSSDDHFNVYAKTLAGIEIRAPRDFGGSYGYSFDFVVYQ
jgi:hypothetical protein